jgi:hypothetical protein
MAAVTKLGMLDNASFMSPAATGTGSRVPQASRRGDWLTLAPCQHWASAAIRLYPSIPKHKFAAAAGFEYRRPITEETGFFGTTAGVGPDVPSLDSGADIHEGLQVSCPSQNTSLSKLK